jgi:predicted HTH transcriptional regulator
MGIIEINDNGTLNDKMNDKADLNDNVNDKISYNEERKQILAYLTENDEISTAMAAKVIGRSHSTARRVLLQLVDNGIVVATGANKNRKYRKI